VLPIPLAERFAHCSECRGRCQLRKALVLPKHLVTLAELAAYLDVSGENLLELIESEDNAGFPGVRIGEEWLVNLDEVPDWLLRLIKC